MPFLYNLEYLFFYRVSTISLMLKLLVGKLSTKLLRPSREKFWLRKCDMLKYKTGPLSIQIPGEVSKTKVNINSWKKFADPMITIVIWTFFLKKFQESWTFYKSVTFNKVLNGRNKVYLLNVFMALFCYFFKL